MPALARRNVSDPNTGLNPISIAGICVVGAVVLGLILWFVLAWYRRRTTQKRDEARGAAFLSIRGIVKEKSDDVDESSSPQSRQMMSGGFSRNQLTPTIVLPDKVITRPPKTHDEIVQHHRESGHIPQPFTPKPFSFALSAGNETPSPASPHTPTFARQSFLSTASSRSRFSVLSTSSAETGTSMGPTSGTARKVRQLFVPVLPDELLISRVGEKLTVLQSFDDGWCVVGREGSAFVHTAKSLFKTNPTPETDVELGVVPAWCFLKPVPGLKAERPVRSSSLGITVQMSAPGFSSRDELISWSNF